MTENVSSLRSVKVATPPCAANAAIPYVLAVRLNGFRKTVRRQLSLGKTNNRKSDR